MDLLGSLAGPLIGGLMSSILGADEPSYQQPSMNQIQTPVQKALNDLLIKQATGAAEWAKKFEDDMPRRVKEWENQKTNYLNQTPTTTVNKPTEVAPAVEEKPKETFIPNEKLEGVAKQFDQYKQNLEFQKRIGIPNVGTVPEYFPESLSEIREPFVGMYNALHAQNITPQMFNAYLRQRLANQDAELLKGVK